MSNHLIMINQTNVTVPAVRYQQSQQQHSQSPIPVQEIAYVLNQVNDTIRQVQSVVPILSKLPFRF